MIIVKPLDDELAEGHRQRHMHIFGFTSDEQQREYLRAYYGQKKKRSERMPDAFLLAISAGMTPDEYVRRHTMLPPTRVAAWSSLKSVLPDTAWNIAAIKFGFAIPTSAGRLCLDCINEDRQQQRTSGFRRIHHLPGIDYCPIHRNALYAVSNEHPFKRMPITWVDKGDLRPIAPIEDTVPDRDWVERYRAICLATLYEPAPFLAKALNYELMRMMNGAGYTTDARHPLTNLSDVLLTKIGPQWAAKFLPKIAEKPINRYYTSVDGVGQAHWSVRPTLLYCAMWACLDRDPWTSPRLRQQVLEYSSDGKDRRCREAKALRTVEGRALAYGGGQVRLGSMENGQAY